MKAAIVASWATVAPRHATIGDHLAVNVVLGALQEAGLAAEHASSIETLQRPRPAPAARIWVCGPVDFSYARQQEILGTCGEGWIVSGASIIENSSLAAVKADLSTARDRPGHPTNADFAALAPKGEKARVASIILRGHQPEYRQDPSIHLEISEAVSGALATTMHFPMRLDTTTPSGLDPLTASATLEALLEMSDVVITSRLHGIVHAVRARKYPVVIDEVISGGKVSACAKEFGIPVLSLSPTLSEEIVAQISVARNTSSESIALLHRRMQQSAASNLKKLLSIVTTDPHLEV